MVEVLPLLQAAEAVIHIADMMAESGLSEESVCQELLLEVMPLVLGNGSLTLKAFLFWTSAMIPLRHASKHDLRRAARCVPCLHFLWTCTTSSMITKQEANSI